MDYIAKNCSTNAKKDYSIKNLVDKYNSIANSVVLYGQNQSSMSSQYQVVFEKDIYYNDSEKTPKYVSLLDLQQAVNYLETRFSKNCNCAMIPHMCQSCQAECSNDIGYQEPETVGGRDNRSECYDTYRYKECVYACPTVKCQSVDTTRKSCESCQSCQSCQLGTMNFSCQSCQEISCQSLSCQANKSDMGSVMPNDEKTNSTLCQTCQRCESKSIRTSCQTQCH